MQLPPTAANRWRFVRRLKGSGQSLLCVVERIADKAQGVLKTPKPEASQRDRLARETTIIGSTNHPAIVRLLDHDLDGDPLWLVTPLGEPLPDWWSRVASHGGSEERLASARRIAFSLLEGLSVVHREGVVHRDIKPQNVIVIADSPILIDFGIAFLPEAERLTELDGRPVANKFAAPHAAYYGQIDQPKPWWDCLGIAWLWGWMLSEGAPPKDHRYHWKYHRMIPGEESERVRALLAACSDEATSPTDAVGMLRLASELGLAPSTPVRGSSNGDGFADAAAVHARELQKALLQKQMRRERAEGAALALAAIYEAVRTELKAVVMRAREANLPVRIDALLNDHPIASLLSSLKESRNSVCLFECTAQRERAPLRISLECEYRPVVDACWPFRFTLEMHPGIKFPANDVIHLTDGRPLADWGRESVDQSFFPRLLEKWLRDPANWEFNVI